MTIFAQGPLIRVVLNGSPVCAINLDEWTVPGKRPDGSDHKFPNIAIASMARSGYVGFQDLGGNCWFNQIKLRKLSPASAGTRGTLARKATAAPAANPAPSTLEPYVETARFEGHTDRLLETIKLSPDGKKLLTGCEDKTARLWDISSGRELVRLWHPNSLRPVAFHPDGKRAVTGCYDGFVRLWDLETGKLIRLLSKHPGTVNSVAVSANGLVLSGGDKNSLRLLEVETGRELRQFDGISTDISSVAITPDGGHILAGGHDLDDLHRRHDSTAAVTPSAQFKRLSPPRHTARVWDLAFAPDNRHAVSAGLDGMLVYWDLDARSALRQTRLENGNIRCAAFEPDGRHVVFGGLHGKAGEPRAMLGFWDVAADRPTRLIPHDGTHLGLAVLPSGAVATADDGGVARIWEPSKAFAQARELRKTGKHSEALLEYDQAIAGRPNDARLLIEREGGCSPLRWPGKPKQTPTSEAAVRIAPENPQLFLEAGWWVAGPYPQNFGGAGALESSRALDPSKPAPPSRNETLRWHDLPTEPQGIVDFGKLFKANTAVAYAMSVVYSPERPRSRRTGGL